MGDNQTTSKGIKEGSYQSGNEHLKNAISLQCAMNFFLKKSETVYNSKFYPKNILSYYSAWKRTLSCKEDLEKSRVIVIWRQGHLRKPVNFFISSLKKLPSAH